MNQTHTPIMSEQDLVKTILADEKRTVTEYATAATEASCQVVRDAFTQLFQDTLQVQGQVFKLMSDQGWYKETSYATQQELLQTTQQQKQTGQQTGQWMQQNGLTANAGTNVPNPPAQSRTIGPNGQLM